jgi:multiple sugar transport system ATP-binding protein
VASVELRGVSQSFGALQVLQELNLEVPEGEFLVLLGPSGCGKSTLLNCIAGLLEVTSGQIHINGKNVTWEEPANRGIGMVFQSYALYPQMTVEGNMSFGLRISGMPKPEIATRVARAAEILQIQPLLKRKPGQLSGGQRQRVAIGRALVRDVGVFLFDEPLSNLDAKLRSELRVEIKRLHQKLGNTMIYVTHDQIEALTLADRIAVMKGGVIQQLDEPLKIYNRPVNLFVAGFIGSPSMNFVRGRTTSGGSAISFGTLTIPLAGYQAAGTIADSRDVILGLRPEHMRLNGGPAAAGDVVVDAVVELDEPMGADSLVWLRVEDKPVSVRVESKTRYQPGQPVKLTFNLGAASVFDAETEKRL